MLDQFKIGVGIITCDRPHFFEKCKNSVKNTLLNYTNSYLICINDGEKPLEECINTSGREGVAVAKNLALKKITENKCDYFFLIEDDIEIINFKVFEEYIQTSLETGIKHFNYGLHGNHNLFSNGVPNIRKTIKYPSNRSIDLYPNLLGAFSFFSRDVIENVGFLDERFYNAMEHVDHTYQIILKEYHPPFRWFADISNSNLYLKDIVPDHNQSTIRSKNNFQEIFIKGVNNFIEKNGFSVVSNYGPPEKLVDEKETLSILKKIWNNHAKK